MATATDVSFKSVASTVMEEIMNPTNWVVAGIQVVALQGRVDEMIAEQIAGVVGQGNRRLALVAAQAGMLIVTRVVAGSVVRVAKASIGPSLA